MTKWFVQIRQWLGGRLYGLAVRVGGQKYGGPTATARVSVSTPDIRPTEYDLQPVDPYAGDWLGRGEFGAGLATLTQYGSASGVVLVDGEWGSGKTTFVRMWAASLRNEGRTVVEVNAWAGDYGDSPFEDIVKQFERGLREQHGLLSYWRQPVAFARGAAVAWASSVKVLSVLVAGLDSNAIGSIATLVRALHRAAKTCRSQEERMRSLKERLSTVALYYRTKRRRSLVLVIDEIDRCRPDYALRFLETVKHVFEVPNVTFVVAANATELGNAVNGVYGTGFDGRGYVERFFDIRLVLPVGDRRNFVKRCLEEQSFKSAAGKDVSFIVGNYSGTAEEAAVKLLEASLLSPREIKKAVKHISITLLFNRWELEYFAETVVFLGIVRHMAREAYVAMEQGKTNEVVTEQLLGAMAQGAGEAEFAAMVGELVAWVRRTESPYVAARQALESIQTDGEERESDDGSS